MCISHSHNRQSWKAQICRISFDFGLLMLHLGTNCASSHCKKSPLFNQLNSPSGTQISFCQLQLFVLCGKMFIYVLHTVYLFCVAVIKKHSSTLHQKSMCNRVTWRSNSTSFSHFSNILEAKKEAKTEWISIGQILNWKFVLDRLTSCGLILAISKEHHLPRGSLTGAVIAGAFKWRKIF